MFYLILYYNISTGLVPVEGGMVMERPKNFNEQIKSIRKEALELGYSISTMDKYLSIWKKFITWKNELNFISSGTF